MLTRKETNLKEVRPKGVRKARHRQALIDATIDTISQHGIVGASVTRIIEKAKLSRGMISLHFKHKDDLLVEAARHMSHQYYATTDAVLAKAGDSPQEVLEAVIVADLDPQTLNRASVNVWYAFRGEARSKNAFATYADTRDAKLRQMMLEAFTRLAGSRKDADALARDATHGTIALLEGMWTDFLLHSDQFNRETAKRIVFRFLSALFPRHFDLAGAKHRKRNSS